MKILDILSLSYATEIISQLYIFLAFIIRREQIANNTSNSSHVGRDGSFSPTFAGTRSWMVMGYVLRYNSNERVFQWKLHVRIPGACAGERVKLSVVRNRVWKENPSEKKNRVADRANNRAKEIYLSFRYSNIINFVIKEHKKNMKRKNEWNFFTKLAFRAKIIG